MVIVDWFTKIIQLKVTTMNILSEEIVKIYKDKIWKLYGVLRKVLNDKEADKSIGNKKNIINSISSSIRWTNRTNQSRGWNILMTLC